MKTKYRTEPLETGNTHMNTTKTHKLQVSKSGSLGLVKRTKISFVLSYTEYQCSIGQTVPRYSFNQMNWMKYGVPITVEIKVFQERMLVPPT